MTEKKKSCFFKFHRLKLRLIRCFLPVSMGQNDIVEYMFDMTMVMAAIKKKNLNINVDGVS